MGAASHDQPWRDKETLEHWFVDEDLTIRETAAELECGRRTVTNWLYRLDIKEPSGDKVYHDADLMQKLYVEQELSAEEIAEEFECSELTVQRWLARHGISRQQINPSSAWTDEERLDRLYTGLGLTLRETGDILGCSHDCVRRWLGRFDIEIVIPKWRDWTEIVQFRENDELEAEDLAADLDISVDVVERQLARYQKEVIENRPAPHHKPSGYTKPWHDRDRLDQLYNGEELSAREIADRLGCGESTVYRWLHTFGVKPDAERPWTNKELLENLYLDEGLTSYEIAEEFGCAPSTVNRWRHKLGISKDEKPPLWQYKGILETLYTEEGWSVYEVADELDCDNSTISEWLRRHNIKVRGQGGGPYQDEETLRQLYVRQKMNMTEIAEKLDCSSATVSYWLARHGIPSRTREDVTHRLFNSMVEKEEPFTNRELLYEMYVRDGMSISEIATELGCSPSPVRVNVEKFGLGEEKKGFDIKDLDYEIPDEYPWRDEELLELLYVEHQLSMDQIGDLIGCVGRTVSQWVKKFGIEPRERYEKPSKVELKRLYVDKKLSGLKIAKRLEVSPSTVYKWLRDYGIETRSVSDYSHPTLDDPKEMKRMYVEEGMTMSAIGEKLSASPHSVRDSLDKFGIKVRPQRVEIKGKKSPFWKGGKEPYGKGWTEEKRRNVLERDEFLCQSCGDSQEEHREEHGQGLHIHHIIPAEQLDDPEERNALSNLVSMCSVCHKKWEGIPLKPSIYTE